MYIVSTVNQEEEYMYTNELKIQLHLEVRKNHFGVTIFLMKLISLIHP